jgi:hypothetical protein
VSSTRARLLGEVAYLKRTINVVCATRDPADDEEVRRHRDFFTEAEWDAIIEAARESLRSSVAGAVLSRRVIELATLMGLVVNKGALQADLFESVRSQRDGVSTVGDAALRRRPGGARLLHALGVVELMAVVAASGEIDDMLTS